MYNIVKFITFSIKLDKSKLYVKVIDFEKICEFVVSNFLYMKPFKTQIKIVF